MQTDVCPYQQGACNNNTLTVAELIDKEIFSRNFSGFQTYHTIGINCLVDATEAF